MTTHLQNAFLSIDFNHSENGPRLAWVRHQVTGETFSFGHAEEISLVVLTPQQKDDPRLEVSYALQNQLTFQGQKIAVAGDRVEFRWASTLVTIEIVYELEPDAPVVRKTIRCTAGKERAYIAGVRHWMLKPQRHEIAWPPTNEPMHQPAVMLGEKSGLLATLEWSMTKLTREDGGFTLEFRPGYMLESEQTREVTAGSLICFECRQEGSNGIESARQAFFAHLARRVRPTVPRPIKFTTWGPWLGQVSDARIREILPALQDVGTDLLHIDAGWQPPDHPFSRILPKLRDVDDSTWDREMVFAERYPHGLQPIRALAEQHGMKLSLWFDTCCDVFLREGETWAIRQLNGEPLLASTWEGRYSKVPKQSLASEYGERLREFAVEMLRRYDLYGVVFDNHYYRPDFATGRQSMANGWNAESVQHRIALEILDELHRLRPGLYRFYCESISQPWVLLHATHLHASDPSITKDFARATVTDYPLRCLAYERRLAWRKHYENFVPPWGVKGDIAGWSLQQRSAIPLNLVHTDLVPGSGEGWTQNMFTCFATTIHRDIRFAFRQMPEFDRRVLKEWLAWDRRRAAFPLNARPLGPPQTDPDNGVEIITQVTNGRGILYLFNQSFARAEAEIRLDESAGFRPDDKNVPAHLVYPLRARLGEGRVSYGQVLKIPLIAKDCAVIEIGLEPPPSPASYYDYVQATQIVQRSFEPVLLTSQAELIEYIANRPLSVETGTTAIDRHLASQILTTLSAATGKRMSLEDCAAVAPHRLIIGTFDGLAAHSEIGSCFRETLYNRYVEWNGQLISAPLVARLTGASRPTFCLIAPRPEQLARLGIRLAANQLATLREVQSIEDTKNLRSDISFDATIPQGRPVLRFRPSLRRSPNSCAIEENLDLIHYTIKARVGERELVLWEEEVPPFLGAPWWGDRVLSLGDLAGEHVRLSLSARHRDGRSSAMLTGGFEQVAVMTG